MGRRPDIARREELLDQIEEIILAEGFLGLRMGDLAKRLHCSRTTLYQLAPTKDELVTRVFTRYAESTLASCRMAADECDEPAEKIRAYFAEAARAVQAPSSDAYWKDVLQWEPAAAIREETYRSGMDRVLEYIEQGIRLGVFRKVNSRFLTYLGWVGAVAARDGDRMHAANLTPADTMTQLGEFIISSLEPA